MTPPSAQNIHHILSARRFPNPADHEADRDVPTVAVSPADVTSPGKNYVPSEQQEEMSALKTRKAGRPRLDAGAVLSEDRRKQVRRAQRTYRLKKEATLQQTKQRVVDLEKKLDRVSSSFADLMQNLKPSERATNPALTKRLDAIYALLADGQPAEESPKEGSENNHSIIDLHSPLLLSSQRLEPSLPPLHARSYSHHEKTFTRHLHRLSLEHAFHLFHDPCSPPLKIYQVFRLVPCIRDKRKMDPYFRRLVSAGRDEALDMPSLPFYCMGGAGTHYPELDEDGRPVYPVNRRVPRRVLGGLDVGVGVDLGSGKGMGDEEEERRLQAYGLGGTWFDCRDVEGYLREMGVRLDEGLGSVGREVMMEESVREGTSSDSAAEQLQASLLESVERTDGKESSPGKACRRILNIDLFLSKLLQGLVILGRAPGFRRSDVVSAFHAALSS